MDIMIKWIKLHGLVIFGILFFLSATIIAAIILKSINAMETYRINEFDHFGDNLSYTAKELIVREDGFVMLATMMKTLTNMSHVRYIEYYQSQKSAIKTGETSLADLEFIDKLKSLGRNKNIKVNKFFYIRKDLPRYDVLEEKGTFYLVFDLSEYVKKRNQILLATILVVAFSMILAIIMYFLEKRNHSLMHTQIQLEREKRKSTNMIKAITHDAKHYLTVINLRLNGLLRQHRKKMTINNIEEDLQLALDNTKSINTFLDSLVEDERILSGEEMLSPQPINILIIINEVLQDLHHQLESKKIKCKIVSDGKIPNAWVDPKALKRTLLNLILNSIKFSAENTCINISVKKRVGQLLFKVQDQGKGIDSKDWEHIFDPFVRLDSKIKGTGQGLTTSRRLIELSGGKLKVLKSELGKGTTFVFSLLMAKS